MRLFDRLLAGFAGGSPSRVVRRLMPVPMLLVTAGASFADDANEPIVHNGVAMRYTLDVKLAPNQIGMFGGTMPAKTKLPLYISLHNAAKHMTAASNDEAWKTMRTWYANSVTNGLCVAVRSVSDNKDIHHTPDSYPLYDLLIRHMMDFHNADPNRVYLLGYGAGGDGVYQISARMPDRFAAVCASAGNPNGLYPFNNSALPTLMQVGMRDKGDIPDDARNRVAHMDEAMVLASATSYFNQLKESGQPPGPYSPFRDFDYFRGCRSAAVYEYDATMRMLSSEVPGCYFPKLFYHVKKSDDIVDNSPDRRKQSVLLNNYRISIYDMLSHLGMPRVIEKYAEMLQNFEALFKAAHLAGVPMTDKKLKVPKTPKEHLQVGDENVNAVDWVSKFTRNPLPQHLQWNVYCTAPTRDANTFYWLEAAALPVAPANVAGQPLTYCTVDVAFQELSGDQIFLFNSDDNSPRVTLTLLLNNKMGDISKPILLNVNDRDVSLVFSKTDLTISDEDGVTNTHPFKTPEDLNKVPGLLFSNKDIIINSVQYGSSVTSRTLADRGDPNYQFDLAVTVTVPTLIPLPSKCNKCSGGKKTKKDALRVKPYKLRKTKEKPYKPAKEDKTPPPKVTPQVAPKPRY